MATTSDVEEGELRAFKAGGRYSAIACVDGTYPIRIAGWDVEIAL